jgi:phosphate starvation-inducible protein PhoH and related proteins
MSKNRRNKKLTEEELREVESFVYSKNMEEDKYLSSMFVNVKCKNENQKKLVQSIKDNEITIVSGLPGTGKTFIACAEALKLIKSRGKYKKILLVKSVTQLPGEELGFLPGDLSEKLDPYMISFIDNFEKIVGESLTKKLRELGIINIQPLAFVRGRSIDNTIIIVDEAQNISISNMRTLMTRIGDNSKMVILGDVKQKDIKKKSDSSLEVIIEKFNGVEGFGTVTLRDPDDVVRNPIIKVIESTFDDIESK